MKYAAYDTLSIYGTGDTPEEAVAKARRDLGEPDAEFDTGKITDEFAAQIEQNGWDGSRQTFAINADGFLYETTDT